ncbi:unnamed protein product [Vicia faba]|uniref:Uncharacterized protein n=1 Tax=Vicia faba TaxID=3906 RepID=A0AAV0YM33_VICFA|nr:unnamed protein product [Vicia faba]
MKCKCFIKEESDLIDAIEESDFIITSDNDDATNDESDSIVISDDDAIKEEIDSIVTSDVEEATKEAKPDVVSLSFLEKDDSFLSPWSWNPDNDFSNDNASTKEKKYIVFFSS